MGLSSIFVTEPAKEQILEALAQKPGKSILRVEAKTNGTSEFAYSMRLISEDEKSPEDVVVQLEGLKVVMDSKSAGYMDGTTIDFEDRI